MFIGNHREDPIRLRYQKEADGAGVLLDPTALGLGLDLGRTPVHRIEGVVHHIHPEVLDRIVAHHRRRRTAAADRNQVQRCIPLVPDSAVEEEELGSLGCSRAGEEELDSPDCSLAEGADSLNVGIEGCTAGDAGLGSHIAVDGAGEGRCIPLVPDLENGHSGPYHATR